MESMLISILIAAIVFAVVWMIINLLPIDATFKQIARLIVGAIALIYLIKVLLVLL